MNMAKMMLKIIVNKVIIKVHKYNSNDGIEYESEDDDGEDDDGGGGIDGEEDEEDDDGIEEDDGDE